MKRTSCRSRVSLRWVALLWLLPMLGCEEPAVPTHRVGTAELPVVTVETANGVDADEFQLIQLKDGHDYWFYRRRRNDSGYAALAHAPDCAKCLGKRELEVDENEE